MSLETFDIIVDTSGKRGLACTLCSEIFKVDEDDDGKCLAYDISIRSKVNLCLACRNAKAAQLEIKFEEMAEEQGFEVFSGKRALASLVGFQWVYGNKTQLPNIHRKIDELASKRTGTVEPYCISCRCLGAGLSCITCIDTGYNCKGSCFCCSNYWRSKETYTNNEDRLTQGCGRFSQLVMTIPGAMRDLDSKNLSYCFCCNCRVTSKPCPYCTVPNMDCCNTCRHCNDKGKDVTETPDDSVKKELKASGYAVRNLLGNDDTEVPSYRNFCSCCNFELNKLPCYLCVKQKELSNGAKCDPKCESCNPDIKKDGDTSENQPRKPRMNRKNEIVIIGDHL